MTKFSFYAIITLSKQQRDSHMYYQTNPLIDIAESYGFTTEDVQASCGMDIYVSYETTRRFVIGDIAIILYRMASGNYEVTHYPMGDIASDINDFNNNTALAICSRIPVLIKNWKGLTANTAHYLLNYAKTQAQKRMLLKAIAPN